MKVGKLRSGRAFESAFVFKNFMETKYLVDAAVVRAKTSLVRPRDARLHAARRSGTRWTKALRPRLRTDAAIVTFFGKQ